MSAAPQDLLDTGIEGGVGQSVARLEAREKVTGRAVYTDDMTLPGMLHGVIIPSAYAHARILSIDTSAAEALPGVKAVITGRSFNSKLIGSVLKDEPPLAIDKVRYIGEPVAAIAAVDEATAREAINLVEIEYEELEAVFDMEAALAEDAPVIHENKGDYAALYELPEIPNAAAWTQYAEGDTAAAWAQCDVIVEGEYETPAQEHMYMEPCSSLASVDGNGKVTLWSSLQSVFRVQTLTAEALAMPMSKLRVIAPRIGGGFGGKCELTNQPICVALALAADAPVRLTYRRDEDMGTVKSRHGCRMRMKTGARADGTLVAREATLYFDTGAYADEGPEVSAVGAFFARGPYRIENINVESWCVYTNRHKAGAFRGFGNPQVTFAAESQIDQIAEKLGMDPLALREQNANRSGDRWLGGNAITSGTLGDCLAALRERSGWDERRQAVDLGDGRRRGIGMAAASHISAMLGAGATVRLNEDGTITVNTGAVDIGEGVDTIMSQMVASALQVPLSSINYAAPDTDVSPYNFQTSASRNTYVVGKAVTEAAGEVRDQILRHAAEIFECAIEDVELRPGGMAGIRGVPDAAVPFAGIAGRALYASGGPISGAYNWLFEPEDADPKRSLINGFTLPGVGVFTFAALAVEVEVDTLTGHVKVLQAWSAHDVGRAINPVSVEGQIQGGVVQGLGYGQMEELLWEDGRLINPSMMDYKIPGILDAPAMIHPIILESPAPGGPWGAKGVGEIGLVGAAPALINAIAHACGARVDRIPATPERVLAALDG